MTELLSLSVVWLLGSWHCSIMCGGCSLLVQKQMTFHLGRLTSYLFMGALFFYFGRTVLKVIPSEFSALFVVILTVFLALSVYRNGKSCHQSGVKMRSPPFLMGASASMIPCVYSFAAFAALLQFEAPTFFLGVVLFWMSTIPSLFFLKYVIGRFARFDIYRGFLRHVTLALVVLTVFSSLYRLEVHAEQELAENGNQVQCIPLSGAN